VKQNINKLWYTIFTPTSRASFANPRLQLRSSQKSYQFIISNTLISTPEICFHYSRRTIAIRVQSNLHRLHDVSISYSDVMIKPKIVLPISCPNYALLACSLRKLGSFAARLRNSLSLLPLNPCREADEESWSMALWYGPIRRSRCHVARLDGLSRWTSDRRHMSIWLLLTQGLGPSCVEVSILRVSAGLEFTIACSKICGVRNRAPSQPRKNTHFGISTIIYIYIIIFGTSPTFRPTNSGVLF
jgi:hypothetical protein